MESFKRISRFYAIKGRKSGEIIGLLCKISIVDSLSKVPHLLLVSQNSDGKWTYSISKHAFTEYCDLWAPINYPPIDMTVDLYIDCYIPKEFSEISENVFNKWWLKGFDAINANFDIEEDESGNPIAYLYSDSEHGIKELFTTKNK